MKKKLKSQKTESAIALTVDEAARAARIGKTTLYAAVGRGELRARKVGRRTLILADELREWLAALPIIAP